MDNLDVQIAKLEERSKSNTKRLDEAERKIDALEKNNSILEKMVYRIEKVETAVDSIDKKLDTKIKEDHNKKADYIDYIIKGILTILIGFICYKLGLK